MNKKIHVTIESKKTYEVDVEYDDEEETLRDAAIEEILAGNYSESDEEFVAFYPE